MKKLGEYTTRGVVPEGTVERIQLFDGKFDTGFKITGFEILSSSLASSGNSCAAKLSTEDVGAMPSSGRMINMEDNREIAWAVSAGATNGSAYVDSVVDPDNLVVEDLYISGQNGGSDIDICYMITMEKYEFDEWRGALAMVRNRSQS
jgi:hypothetical protein